MTIEEARASIGADVAYRACLPCGRRGEHGVLTSVNHLFAFVRFGGGTPQACLPGDLTLAEAGAEVGR